MSKQRVSRTVKPEMGKQDTAICQMEYKYTSANMGTDV
jgi:hypothetical protein